MLDINRIVIFLLLAALLYALYRYQQQITKIPIKAKPKKIKSKKINKIKYIPKKNEDEASLGMVSISNISQQSIGSLLDTDSSAGSGRDVYKPTSVIGSLESGNTVSLLEDDSSDDFFFQR